MSVKSCVGVQFFDAIVIELSLAIDITYKARFLLEIQKNSF